MFDQSEGIVIRIAQEAEGYVQLGLGRVKRVVFRTPRGRSCWDKDYIERGVPRVREFGTCCKKLGIISTDVAPEVYRYQVGFILMFGMFLS